MSHFGEFGINGVEVEVWDLETRIKAKWTGISHRLDEPKIVKFRDLSVPVPSLQEGRWAMGVLLALLLPPLSFFPPEALSRQSAHDPETGLVRSLYFASPEMYPYVFLRDEPLLRLTPVHRSSEAYTDTSSMMKYMRILLPRSYRDLVDRYDLILIISGEVTDFAPQWLGWFREGVAEGGQGLMMSGGWLTFGGFRGFTSWGGSSVGDVLPAECVAGEACAETACTLEGLWPVPVDEEHEFCTPLPWEAAPPFSGLNIVTTKEGASEILVTRRARRPILVYRDYGKGSSLAHTPDLTTGWLGGFGQWEYYPDYVINMAYLLARLEVPQNIALVHSTRTAIQNYAREKALLIGLSEFVDAFGANSHSLDVGLGRVTRMKEEADALYVGQQYEAALVMLGRIMEEVRDLGGEAVRIKNQALLWIFVIEWLVVTSTAIVCGFVLWSLMVKRGLYREVDLTRLAKA